MSRKPHNVSTKKKTDSVSGQNHRQEQSSYLSLSNSLLTFTEAPVDRDQWAFS